VGCIHTDDAPAMAAVAVATLSINPRRVDVITSSSFDIMDRKDLTDAYPFGYETKADDGDAIKIVAIAVDRTMEDAVMVDVCCNLKRIY
jgi:hypothetical protein